MHVLRGVCIVPCSIDLLENDVLNVDLINGGGG